MDLPSITEAAAEFYRNIYADPELGPIFKGINMVILRNHVSYFIYQLTMFDTPMTQRQIEYLRKVHTWVVQEHRVTQRHYDTMIQLLMEAMRLNGVQDDHLQMVQTKLEPLRSIFPPEEHGSAVVVSAASTPGVQQQTAAAGDSGHHTRKMCHSDTGKAPTSVPGCSEHMGGSKTAPADGERTHRIRGKPNPSRKYPDQNMNSNLESKATKHHSWLQRITGCLRPS